MALRAVLSTAETKFSEAEELTGYSAGFTQYTDPSTTTWARARNHKEKTMTTKKNETPPAATLHVARDRNDFGWSLGTAEAGGKTYRIDIKWFDEPSQFGIRNGHVSKLFVAGAGEGTVINYDRGWDIRPRNARAKAILKAVLKEFN